MKNAFVYPLTARKKDLAKNPYLFNFIDALGHEITFLNSNSPSPSGILNLFKYLNKIDYLFLNWIENLPDKKGGLLQVVLFIVMFQYLRLKKVKIIYTLHNKSSHYRRNTRIKSFLLRFVLRKSSLIITHAREGIEYARVKYSINPDKIHFYHHPVFNRLGDTETQKVYDILIWGTITSYKGTDHFLEHVRSNSAFANYKILIAGKCNDSAYFDRLKQLAPSNVILRNDFISFEEIGDLIRKSYAVLFTYNDNSILSSGALMDSVSYGAYVIGPNSGSFNDLSDEGLIDIYHRFDEIPEILDKSNPGNRTKSSRIRKFILDNTWDNFGRKCIKDMFLH